MSRIFHSLLISRVLLVTKFCSDPFYVDPVRNILKYKHNDHVSWTRQA